MIQSIKQSVDAIRNWVAIYGENMRKQVLLWGAPLLPLVLWGPIFWWWGIWGLKGILMILSCLVGGFLGIRPKIVTEVFEKETSPASTTPLIAFFVGVLPMGLFLWGLIERIPPETWRGRADESKQQQTVSASQRSYFPAEIKAKFKGIAWLPDNRIPTTFTWNEKKGVYEGEVRIPIPDDLAYFEYDHVGLPVGHTFEIRGESADPREQFEHRYQYTNSFNSVAFGIHSCRLIHQHSVRVEKVPLGIALKNCVDRSTGKKVLYLLARQKVHCQNAITLTIPKDMSLRDVILVPPWKKEEMAQFKAYEEEGLSSQEIPLQGFPITFNRKEPEQKLFEKWREALIEMDEQEQKSLRKRAWHLLQSPAWLPFPDIPAWCMYYQVGKGPRKVLTQAVRLSGLAVAGQTISIGLNTPMQVSWARKSLSDLSRSALAYVVVTALQP